MRVDILTIFPELFMPVLETSMLGIAQREGILEVYTHDLRDWTDDFHRTVDDEPYGGGPGMVMKCEPIFRAVEAIGAMDSLRPTIVFLAPVGEPFKQAIAQEFSKEARLLLVCGRYEGFDERTFTLADRIISIGDYVLTGGEIAALAVIDATVRLIPGVLGHAQSCEDESFSDGLLEYPHYTRPSIFNGVDVPAILLSGNHKEIERWRRMQSLERTQRLRPDLLKGEN
ncbi:MAG: tRNA (guanosine(37)-N1)-methyltransferase TrmD [Coriobacteriia bacterium]|nr:tRNA (guanosine(37)-N1)-methyltransferase TrmD [Coriobacteriia bacterium]